MRALKFAICLSIALLSGSVSLGAEELALADSTLDINVAADNISFDPSNERFTAKGAIELEVGETRISASLLFLDVASATAVILKPVFLFREGLELTGARTVVNLKTGAFELDDPKLDVSTKNEMPVLASGNRAQCEKGVCTIEDASATACPHRPAGWHLLADEIVIRESGDFDLTWPTLEVDGTALAAVPWIRLRQGNKFGFLPPRLGWDSKGGLVIGPAGHIPLGKEAYTEGHVAARTAQGLETRTAIHTSVFDFSVDHLFDVPYNLLRFRGDSNIPLNKAYLNTHIDLATNRQIIEDLAASPLERALTHAVNRVLSATEIRGFFIETYAELMQSFDAAELMSKQALLPKASIELGLPVLPVLRYFWPTLSLKLTRIGISSPDLFQDAAGIPAASHSRLEASYGFWAPLRAGPVNVGITAAGRHQAWLPDSGGGSESSVHLASAEAYVTLPLAGRFGSLRHRIDPFIRYRITPLLEGEAPFWIVDDFDRLRRSQGMEAGLSTALDNKERASIIDLHIWERIDLPGFGRDAGFAYIAGSATAGPSWLSLAIDGSFDHEYELPSTAGISLRSRHETSSIELGGRWVGEGRGPHMDQPFSSASSPWITSFSPQFQGSRLEIFEELKVALTRRLGANAGARIGAWPDRSLHALWYGLELRSSCGCLSAQIVASHRLDTAVPDIMTTFRIEGM